VTGIADLRSNLEEAIALMLEALGEKPTMDVKPLGLSHGGSVSKARPQAKKQGDVWGGLSEPKVRPLTRIALCVRVWRLLPSSSQSI